MREVGKLFKKLTLWDWAIGAFALLLIFAFFLFFYRKPALVNIRLKVTDEEVLYVRTQPKTWYANRFVKGDVEKDALGRSTAEIVGVESFNVTADRKAVYLDLRVRASYDTRSKVYSFKGKPLVFGVPLRFNFSLVTVDGIVTEFPGSADQIGYKVGEKEVRGITRNVESAIAQAVKTGDKIFDSNGILLAEVTDIEVTPAQKVTQTDRGELLLRSDPLYKDILIRVKLRTKSWQGEEFIFDDIPLKIGELLPLNFENVSLYLYTSDLGFQ